MLNNKLTLALTYKAGLFQYLLLTIFTNYINLTNSKISHKIVSQTIIKFLGKLFKDFFLIEA